MPKIKNFSTRILKLVLILILSSCTAAPITSSPSDPPIEAENPAREPQSKQPRLSIRNLHNPQIAGPADCSHVSYPDPKYTPGATFSHLTEKELCVPGYTSTVRNVPDKVARQVFVNYGIESQYLTKQRANYEVDHFISLELGGSNDVSNLWPQPYDPLPGARQKDVVETNLHHRVCNHELTLSQAQDIIKRDWCAEYLNILSRP